MNDGTAEARETATPWWQRLATGLKRSSSALGGAIAHVVAKRQLDEATIEEIEDALIRADLGTETARPYRRGVALWPVQHRDHG